MGEKTEKEGRLSDLTQSLTQLPPFRTEVLQMIRDSGIPVLRIAKKLGVSRSRLDYHLKGNKRINPEVLGEIRKAINELNTETLKYNNQKKLVPVFSYPDNVKIAEARVFPILKKIQFINGVLIMSQESITGYALFPFGGNEAFVIEYLSDDMKDSSSSRSIEVGDIMLVDKAIKVITGDVVLVGLYGERSIVRMIRFGSDGEKVTLKAFNPEYPEMELSMENIDYIWKIVEKHGKITKM